MNTYGELNSLSEFGCINSRQVASKPPIDVPRPKTLDSATYQIGAGTRKNLNVSAQQVLCLELIHFPGQH